MDSSAATVDNCAPLLDVHNCVFATPACTDLYKLLDAKQFNSTWLVDECKLIGYVESGAVRRSGRGVAFGGAGAGLLEVSQEFVTSVWLCVVLLWMMGMLGGR